MTNTKSCIRMSVTSVWVVNVLHSHLLHKHVSHLLKYNWWNKKRWLNKGRYPCSEEQIKFECRKKTRGMQALSLTLEADLPEQMESCFRLSAICSSCSTNSLLIFHPAHWGSTESVTSVTCMVLLGFAYIEGCRWNSLAHSHLHTLTWTLCFLAAFPGSLISSIAITCGWMVLNLNLSRGSVEC